MQELLNKIDLDSPDYMVEVKDYNLLYSNIFDSVVRKATKIEETLSTYYNTEPIEKPEGDNIIAEENVLLISEIDKKVILPYTLENIQKTLEENQNFYDTMQDVIDKKYTRPLSYYKHSSFARFKEAFKLVKYREGGSFFEAMDLAMELFSNYHLHPAVISACKNLNELDVYLSCLEYNELDDFHFFKTIFKMNPINIKAIKTWSFYCFLFFRFLLILILYFILLYARNARSNIFIEKSTFDVIILIANPIYFILLTTLPLICLLLIS